MDLKSEIDKICLHCGGEIPPSKYLGRRKFCGDKCQKSARLFRLAVTRRERRERGKNCAGCGIIFWPHRSNTLFCSRKCQGTTWKAGHPNWKTSPCHALDHKRSVWAKWYAENRRRLSEAQKERRSHASYTTYHRDAERNRYQKNRSASLVLQMIAGVAAISNSLTPCPQQH
jgi:hypothetical protein